MPQKSDNVQIHKCQILQVENDFVAGFCVEQRFQIDQVSASIRPLSLKTASTFKDLVIFNIHLELSTTADTNAIGLPIQ
jgi:hypothetical protein